MLPRSKGLTPAVADGVDPHRPGAQPARHRLYGTAAASGTHKAHNAAGVVRASAQRSTRDLGTTRLDVSPMRGRSRADLGLGLDAFSICHRSALAPTRDVGLPV